MFICWYRLVGEWAHCSGYRTRLPIGKSWVQICSVRSYMVTSWIACTRFGFFHVRPFVCFIMSRKRKINITSNDIVQKDMIYFKSNQGPPLCNVLLVFTSIQNLFLFIKVFLPFFLNVARCLFKLSLFVCRIWLKFFSKIRTRKKSTLCFDRI